MSGEERSMTEQRSRPDYVLLATVCALVCFGLVMVYSASFVDAFRTKDGNQYYYLFRQMIGALIGGAGMFLAMRIEYQTWRRYALPITFGALVLLGLVLVLPASVTEVNGSRSWIRFGEGVFGLISVQPAEIAKLAMIIYFSAWLSRRGDKLANATQGLLPFSLALGLVCFLVFLQPDLGTMAVIMLIGAAIYFAAGANLVHIFGAALLALGSFWVLLTSVRNARIEAFLNPEQFADSFGYHPTHALYALGSGGWLGAGLGQSRQKFLWLPQAHTDTILAIIGEELGLLGTVGVLLAFAVIAYRGFRIAGRVADPFAALMAVGITSWIALQGILNMAVTTSLTPFTGLTLPFLSYGNTSLMISMIGIGILLNISRHVYTRETQEAPDGASSSGRSPAHALFNSVSERWRNGRARVSGPRRRRSAR
jgi:cell division protein FtsW